MYAPLTTTSSIALIFCFDPRRTSLIALLWHLPPKGLWLLVFCTALRSKRVRPEEAARVARVASVVTALPRAKQS